MIRGLVLLTVLLVVLWAAPAARAQEGLPVVAGIRVEGLVHLEAGFILSKVESKEGDPLGSELVREDLRRIGETEGVHSVEVLKEDIEGGVGLIFRIEEWPVLKGVTVSGTDVLGSSRVEEVLVLPEMRFFEEHVLEDDLRRVRALYRERGFGSVKVGRELETDEDGTAVSVTIRVQEGVKAVIGDIRIEGLEPGDEKALLKIMKTRKSGLFKKHVLDPDVFEEDLERVVAFCMDRGYLDARVVDHEFDIDEKARRMAVRMKVDRGERYLTGDVRFEGPFRVVSKKKLEGLIQLKEGVPYGPGQLAFDRKAITDAYYKRGYIFVAVDSVPSIDRDARKVAIKHEVREGVIARVERVDIIGNTKTRDKVIRRELKLRPGDVFEVDKLRRSRDNLWRTRYFDDVSFDILPGSADDLKRITFNVEEGRTGNILFGGGYNTVDGMFGRIEMDVLNFDITNPGPFSGGGQQLHLVAEGGSERRYFDLSFDEPWFMDQPRTLGFDIYDKTRFWDYYDEESLGVRPRYGWHLGEYTRAILSYRYEEADVRDIAPDASPEIAAEEDSYATSRFQFVIARDDIILDRVFFPHKGSSKKLMLELADSFLGSDKEFLSYVGEAKWYWPVWDQLVLAANMEAGMVDEYGDTERVPIQERFFAGGPGSVRGYRYRTVGPKDENNEPLGGRYMLVGNLELTYPVTDTIRAAVFADSGQVWEDQGDIKLSNLRSAAGLGVRVKIPGSPMSFHVDWAWALDREAGDNSGEMSFGMRAF